MRMHNQKCIVVIYHAVDYTLCKNASIKWMPIYNEHGYLKTTLCFVFIVIIFPVLCEKLHLCMWIEWYYYRKSIIKKVHLKQTPVDLVEKYACKNLQPIGLFSYIII